MKITALPEEKMVNMEDKKHIPSYLIGFLIVITIQMAGFALLWNKIAAQPEYVYLPATVSEGTTGVQTPSPVVVVSPPDEKALREIIKTVLEQELAAYAVCNSPNSSNKKEKPSQVSLTGIKENSPENLQAFEKIKNIVDSAIAKGKWTMGDTVAASAYSRSITENQRIELTDKIGNAINSQTMELSPESPPMF
jgi:hypothetical protein